MRLGEARHRLGKSLNPQRLIKFEPLYRDFIETEMEVSQNMGTPNIPKPLAFPIDYKQFNG